MLHEETTLTRPAKPIWLLLCLLLLLLHQAASYKVCSAETGGGICPDHNTCCATGKPGMSSCISAREGEEGDCCLDDGRGVTGCKAGYECKSGTTGNLRKSADAQQDFYCHRIDPDYNGTKPKPVVIPRYQLCTVPHKALTQVYGLPLRNDSGNNLVNVAYFSTMGSLDSSIPSELQKHQRVSTVFIVVHGSRRTAGDYLYGAASSLPKDQQDPNNATMMVLSPWFLDPEDDDLVLSADSPLILEQYNESHPIPIPLPPNTLRWVENSDVLFHTWRYGANAIDSDVSSFAAVDKMVEVLVNDPVRFPSLRRILVAGHSAGGQFVHRWALLSNSPVWEQEQAQQVVDQRAVNIRVIPANPRCFAYLDDRRFVRDPLTNETIFRRPDDQIVAQCPNYNEWIWGLEPGGNVTAPYKDKAIEDAGGAEVVAKRYVSTRRCIYLAGAKDLEVCGDACGSVIQGKTRRERSHQFMKSLLEAYPEEMNNGKRHNRLLVPGVPHDHSLMFQSPEGKKALFGEDGFDDFLGLEGLPEQKN